jgi:hypothetical protein
MARTKNVIVNDTEFTLQSVCMSWYYNLNDRCGNTGNTGSTDKKNSVKYIDVLFKNVVTSPAEVAKNGIRHFDDVDDMGTAEELLKEIESFLREVKRK